MRIIKLEEDMSKFKPENKEIEVENMRSFVTKYKVGPQFLLCFGRNTYLA
jgi:hypothetical protein